MITFNQKSKKISLLYFLIVFILMIIPNYPIVHADFVEWDDNWSFKQKINIPIQTSNPTSIYQPIDLPIHFTSSCWAKNETLHSIRICCWDGITWHELESQIYNLKPTDDSHIQGCNIVFLIPPFADGTEQYYVYYDDNEKPKSQYIDHVSISESYYRYEPISGYSLEAYYYKILDDTIIPYIVAQKGQIMGYNTGQHVTKMIENATDVIPKYFDLFSAYDFKYSYDDGIFDYSSTSQKLISKEVFIDGNLMLSFGMVSTSKKEDLKTTVTYTYYHCPTDTTRIRAHVKHETLTAAKTLMEASTDGIFASIQSGGINSNSIKDLNVGEILPYLYFTNEFNEIGSYDIDIDPEYIPGEPDIRVVSYKDDVDLGEQPWVAFSQGKQGLAHALLFHSNQVQVSGENERDGLQLNAFQMDFPHLPGLENDIATVQIGRNSYEKETGHDLDIPNNNVIEFDSEFFTSRHDGITAVEQEAELYNLLIDEIIMEDTTFNDVKDDSETFTISIFIRQAPSFPFGSALAVATGLNFSFITAELYQDNEYLGSESAVHIPMNPLNLETETFIEKIKAAIGIIDYRNISLRKKVEFHHITPGIYTIKLFMENPLLASQRLYIGFAEVKVTEDTSIILKGGRQQSLEYTVTDQNKQRVENAEIQILQQNSIIATGFTDNQGCLTLKIPDNIHSYDLIILLQGQECYNETVTQKIIQSRQQHIEISIQQYTIDIDVTDEWSLPIGIDITPILLDENGISLGYAETISESMYQFSMLPPSSYTVVLQYKSVIIQEEIHVNQNIHLSLTFPALYTIDISAIDTQGMSCSDITFHIQRNGKEKQYQSSQDSFQISVPPGQYSTMITKDGKVIAKRNLFISQDSNQLYVTNKESFLPILFYCILIGCAGIILYVLYQKYQTLYLQQILPVMLLISSLIAPWWTIQGSTASIQTRTNLYLLPTHLLTLTESSTIIGGNLGYLPDLFILMLHTMIGFIVLTTVFIIFSYFFNHKKRIYPLLLKAGILIMLLGIASIFLFGMTTFSEITVGTIYGNGPLDVSIPGQASHETIPCQWGPSIGFYLLIITIILYILSLFIHITIDKEGIRWNIKR